MRKRSRSSSSTAAMVEVEGADADGEHDERVLRGDRRVMQRRQEERTAHSRARAAVQAELDRLASGTVARARIAPELLRTQREAVAARGGIVPKTAAKVATDERTWELYVDEQEVEIGGYPTAEQVVEFAIWMTMHRERACLAQRLNAGPRLTGKVRRTIRNMLTELFTHAWPRRWPAYAALDRKERAAYEDAILKQVDGVHKLAAGGTPLALPMSDERERAAQLTAQTGPVTERKHFYRTEVYQIQDALLAMCGSRAQVNGAIALGAVCALMQTTAARCGMLTKDNYDDKSVRWSDDSPLRVRDVSYALRDLTIEGANGEAEATSHMQVNWRRVKRRYYEVYLFRSAVTANSKAAQRRAVRTGYNYNLYFRTRENPF